MAGNTASPAASTPPGGYIRSRIANACDGCKARKVKCDGKQPCSFCVRRQRPDACHYAEQRRPRRRKSGLDRLSNTPQPSPGGSTKQHPHEVETPSRRRDSILESAAEDDTEVPREARLLRDAQGKLIFIGDTAPLSFFQSVRQLVTNRIGQNAFAPETSRYSVLENSSAYQNDRVVSARPDLSRINIQRAVSSYISTTTSLIDLFDESRLLGDLTIWAGLDQKPANLASVSNYLILAIGSLQDEEASSQICFEYAKEQAFSSLSGNLSVGTIQTFVLITVYMLCSCQINSAFLIFGIAVRAAYSIGVHRTEVNARFGTKEHRQRDRLWKSLRVVDLYLSTSMGRPPATSDVDCTVPYRDTDADGNEIFDLLNASVQLLLITEGIVVEIYSRKRISLQLTEGISHQLREWSARWLERLRALVTSPTEHSVSQVSGACQVLASYYYAVMLVSRPFLMYVVFRRLSDETPTASRTSPPISGKSKLADACIDAASLMVDPILDLVHQGVLRGRMPLLVSWVFASSLVLGVGLLGGFGRILEKYARKCIQVLDHFAQSDTHATQYSLIAQSLLNTALECLEKRELQERLRRTESSSQLFGLMPHDTRPQNGASPALSLAQTVASPAPSMLRRRDSQERSFFPDPLQATTSPHVGDIDSAFFGLSDSLMGQDPNFWNSYQGNEGDPGSTLNLFPLLDAGGGIDLAHYL